MLEQRNGRKYAKNTKGLFDCPVPGCDRKGAKGFTTGQGVGAHMRADHPGWWMTPDGTAQGPAAPSAPANGRDVADLAPVDDPAAEFERETGFTDPRATERLTTSSAAVQTVATDAVVAILGVPQVRRLNAEQMKGVFDAVLTIRRLDSEANGHDPAHAPPDAPR